MVLPVLVSPIILLQKLENHLWLLLRLTQHADADLLQNLLL